MFICPLHVWSPTRLQAPWKQGPHLLSVLYSLDLERSLAHSFPISAKLNYLTLEPCPRLGPSD